MRVERRNNVSDEVLRRKVQNGSSEVNSDDGEWRSPVAHSVWDRGVASSNLVSPTKEKYLACLGIFLWFKIWI